MKRFCLFVIFAAIAFACSGDCVSCHASLGDALGKDRDHNVLLTCISCHQQIDSPNAECGGNCFACHSENSFDKSVAEHKTLGDCKSCHISASEGDITGKFFKLDVPDERFKDSLNQTLKPPK
ncbi:MAG: hypothetical protein LBP89_08905 [Helicobacteraceae bacterium]|nr:hypothetical protein [Helicobacteraceae bacterium]